MNITFTRLIPLLAMLITSLPMLNGQLIWPGDFNNNGIVNGRDLLYLGYANEVEGGIRLHASTDWIGQPMSSSWDDDFPGNINFAYGDANGDGVINQTDMTSAIMVNYGKTHDQVLEDIYSPQGNPEVDPLLDFHAEVMEASLGAPFEFEVSLGTDTIALDSFYGIAFTIAYSTEFVDSVYFNRESGWWIDSTHTNSLNIVNSYEDGETGYIEVAITRTNHQPIAGFGRIGNLGFYIHDDLAAVLPLPFKVDIDDITLIDEVMIAHPICVNADVVVLTTGEVPTHCPDIIAPVCGVNGVTYLNSCYAEAAGVTEYSEGVCFGDCINPNLINPNANCDDNYDPVYGCNGVTYINECVALANGVTEFSSGAYNNGDCYDANYIVTSNGTSVDENGVISLNCPTAYEPVCGCNGITYQNACEAEASGIVFYTSGTCSTSCVDADEMDPSALCPTVYEPVCGCNGVTYSNSCVAEAAGVVNYTNGVCGASSSWCNEAIPIQCGDFLANESNVGAGNNNSYYTSCNNYSFYGPDKVYVFNKTTAGDLQIGMEIITPGLDLDLFVLDDNCSQVSCLGQSISNNSQTNNEGIVLEDAPIGTYYIVVDGQYASSTGNYRLEVNCGYLYCGDATPLSCGVPYNGNNINGQDNVSLYGCGNVLNVENNGPEMVHYFTMTNAGQAVINLTNLNANLELFLLNSCDRGDCIDYSQNGGTANEQISAWLQPGTYYVVVDGYNGAISDYTLTANCEATGCDFALEPLTSTPTSCGANNGSITVASWGGVPGFIISYSGPISGSFYTYSNSCTISNLPSGTYVITKTDALGCSDTQTIVVGSQGGLLISVSPNDAACMNNGSVGVNIANGSPSYSVHLSGALNATLNAYTNNFIIDDLPAGNYYMHISDAYGCSSSQSFVIEHTSGNFSYIATPSPATCGGLGSVHVQTSSGIAPFNIQVQGPVSGYATADATSFTIINLPGGTYTVTIEDVNWCQHTEVITIQEEGIDINTYANNAACGAQGSIQVMMATGTPPFNISWTGPVSSSITTSNYNYTIPNLPSGYYSIQVEDANWCSDYDVVQVVTTEGNLSFNLIPIDGTCSQLGAIWVDILNGTAPYSVSWWGPSEGASTVTGDGFDIPNLTGGTYTVQITDASGCSSTQTVTLINGGDLDVDISQIGGGCGQNAGIHVIINGGNPNYTISWNGPSSGTVSVANNQYTINNLLAGTYTVNVTDSSGCTDYEAIQISTSGNNIDLNATPISANCGQLGAIWLDVLGGGAPYTVSWSGPVNGTQIIYNNGLNIDGLPAGTYWITVTDNFGCTGNVDATVNSINNLNVTLSGTNPSCGSYGSVSVNITNGTAPYSISWTGASSGSDNFNSNYYLIDNLGAGTYQVTVTDAYGCVATNAITIYNTSGNINVSATPINGYCGQNGSAVVVISGGAPGYLVSWTGPSNGSLNTVNNTITIPNLLAGAYTISVTDNYGCSGNTTTAIYNGEGGIGISLVPTSGSCGSSGSIHIGITGGNAPFTISWAGSSSGTINTANYFYDIQNLAAGTYTVTVTDVNGCVATQTTTVLTGENNLMVTGSLVYNDCGQYNRIWLDIIGGTAPYIITWTGTESGTYTTSDNAYEIIDLPPGTYIVKVTDASGCMDTQSITIYDAPIELLTLTGINGECGETGSIQTHIINGAPDFQISWSGPVSGTITTTSTNYIISNLPSGTYTVTLLDGNWCTDTEVITINNNTSDLDLNGSLIYNDCGQYNTIWLNLVGGWGPYTITWTGTESGTYTTSDNAYEIQDLPPGTYTVKLTDAHGCMDTEVFTIYDAPIELLTLTGINGECGETGSIQTHIINGAPDFQISWSGPVSGTITTTSTSYIIPNLPSGTYTVTLLDGNWCTDAEVITINNNTSDLDLNGSLIYNDCGQYNTIWLNLVGGWGPYTITWTGTESGTYTTSDNAYEIQDLPPGTYTVKLTDAHGCMDTEVFTIYDAPIELLTLTGINGECGETGSIQTHIINGAPDFQISWSGSVSGTITTTSTSYIIPNLPSGTYTVTLLDGNWCTDTEVITINNNTSDLDLNGSLIYNDCGQYNTIWLNLVGGWGPYTITWTGTESGTYTTSDNAYEIQDLPPGTYTVKLTDAHGCMDTEVFTIYDAPIELLTLTGINGECGETGSIQTHIINGAPDFQISWSGPVSGTITTTSTNYIIPNLPSGTYTVTLLDGNWCTDTEVITITSLNTLSITTVEHNGVCDTPASIDVFITGGTPTYTVSWTGSSTGSVIVNTNNYHLPNLTSGTYNIVVTDANGCTDGETAIVFDIDNTLDIIAVGFNADCDDPGNIHVGIAGGQEPYVIQWNGPIVGSANVNGQSYNIDNLIAGTYSITVIDANGCLDMATVTITEDVGTIDAVFTVYNGFCGGLGNVWMDFNSGNAPYTITWTGIVSGSGVTNTTYYDVLDLPTGSYVITVVDANGCTYTETVVITNIINDVTASLSVNPGGCGAPGSITVNMSGGTLPYTVEWTSVNSSGSQSTNNNYYLMQNLPSGIYYITVSDANGCDVDLNVQLINHPDHLVVNHTVVQPTCNQNGSIGLIINSGQMPYEISWTGAESGSVSVGSSSYIISGLTGGNYTISVSDAGGCYSTDNVHLDESTDTPMVGFTATISGLTASFNNTSAQGNYLWNFGDGNTSTSTNPVHEFSGTGTYMVCLTVTNACGSATYCENVMPMSSADAVILDVMEVTVNENANSLSLPVTIHNCDMLVSLAGSLFVEDETVATITGVTAGVITPQLNLATGSFNYYDNAAQGITIEEGDILFYLEMDVHGEAGMSTNVRIVDDPLAIEVGSMVNNVPTELPHIVVPGSVSITESASGFVIGNVRTFQGDAINNVTVSALSVGNEITTLTNEAGNYSFDDGVMSGQMATIQALKDGPPANGLSTYALFIGQRFILGMDPIQIYSPYQIIAGDANCSGSFSTLDLFIIQQLIIGATDDFANCPSWVFVADGVANMPEDFTAENVFPYPAENTMMVDQPITADFIGVKVGDILGDSNPDELQQIDLEDRTEDDLTFVLENRSVQAGEVISVAITSNDFVNMVSLQAGLSFDQSLFTYRGFTPSSMPRLANMAANVVEDEVRLSWFDLQGDGYSTDGTEVLFTIELEAKEAVSDLLSALAISDRNMQVKAHDSDGNQYGIILTSTEVTNTIELDKPGFKLYQNQPNPFKTDAVIRFELPESMDVVMVFHNHLGEVVKQVNIQGVKGMNKMNLSQLNMGSGVYYYSLKAGAFTDTKSMVIVK